MINFRYSVLKGICNKNIVFPYSNFGLPLTRYRVICESANAEKSYPQLGRADEFFERSHLMWLG